MFEPVEFAARRWGVRLLLTGLLSLVWGLSGTASGATGPSFTALPGALTTARYEAMAASLPGGRVLIAGGDDGTHVLASAEVFDPSTGTFTASPRPMTIARQGAVAAPLPDGDVLIAGGFSGRTLLASAELFHPATGTFTALPASMTTARLGAVAAPLPDGDVLIAGGDDGKNVLSSAEVFDPSTGVFTALAGSMSTARDGAVAAAPARRRCADRRRLQQRRSRSVQRGGVPRRHGCVHGAGRANASPEIRCCGGVAA